MGKEQPDKEARHIEIVSEKVKFEIYGEEMVQKVVRSSGNSGRIYLPPEWIGSRVKVIKC